MNQPWPNVALGELLKPVSRAEKVDPQRVYNILGARWYSKGLYIKETKDGSGINAQNLYLIKEGDFVYNRLFGWKGSFALATKADDGCYVSNEFPSFIIDREILDPIYLWRYFSQEKIWTEALGLSSGGTPTSRNRLKEEKFLSMIIPLPPLPEQCRIVAKIEAMAWKIREARGLRNQSFVESEALILSERDTIFKEALEKASARFDELATLERGKFSHRPRNDPRFFGGDHPWIQIGEIESSGKYIHQWNQTLNDEGLAISRKFPKGTLLVSIAATIGAVGILKFDCCIPDSIVAIIPKPGCDSEFIYHYLCFLRSHLEKIAPQSAQKNINLQILCPLPIPDLSEDEQLRIVSYLDGLQAKVDALKKLQAQTSAELDALLPSILDRAFKGDL